MRRVLGPLTALSLLAAAAPAAAQQTGAFIATLGNDTVAVERFSRQGDHLTGTSVIANPRAALRSYDATFTPDGRIASFEYSSGPVGGQPVGSVRFTYRGDSALIEVTRGTTKRHYAVATGAKHPLPFFEDFFEPWELILHSALPAGADSGTFEVLAGRSVATFTAHRAGPGVIAFAWSEWGSGHGRFGADGRMTELDLTGTTNKYIVRRVPNVDVKAVAAAWAARPQPGQLSPRDTARTEVAGAHVLIDYSRPSLRGRVMFGKLLPWKQIWRLGANAATQLITDKDLVIGGATVPAGTYSLWSVLTDSTWDLIVNKQHGQWGTEYHADSDLVHIPLNVTRLQHPLERFTITLEPANAGGVMRFAWETRAGSVPFAVKR